MECNSCGYQIVDKSNFCSSCGEKTDAYYKESDFPLEKEIETFVYYNSDYYIDKWRESKDPSMYAGWNWAAFLLGLFWLGYRKMYARQFIVSFIVIVILGNSAIPDFPFFLIWLYYGFRANAVYYKYVTKRVEEITNHLKEEVVEIKLKRDGGITVWKSLIIPVLLILFTGGMEWVLNEDILWSWYVLCTLHISMKLNTYSERGTFEMDYKEHIYVSKEFKKELSNINEQLEKLSTMKCLCHRSTKEYRDSLNKEIELLEKKEQLLGQECNELLKSLDESTK